MEKIKREDIEKKENQRQSEVINIMKVSKDIQLSQDTQVFKFVKDMDYTKNNKNTRIRTVISTFLVSLFFSEFFSEFFSW